MRLLLILFLLAVLSSISFAADQEPSSSSSSEAQVSPPSLIFVRFRFWASLPNQFQPIQREGCKMESKTVVADSAKFCW